MKKGFFWVWLVVLILALAGIFIWGMDAFTMCWDGLEVDEPLLMDLCGITREQYFSAEFNPEDCPESEQAVYMVGGCEPQYDTVIFAMVGFALSYLILSGIIYGVWRIIKRVTRE